MVVHLCWNKATNTLAPALVTDISPAIAGSFTLTDGRKAVPSFQLLAANVIWQTNIALTPSRNKCGIEAKNY